MSTVTIRCGLVTTEETRRQLWQLMAEKNTPLVNELLKLISQHPDFEVWRRRGTLPDKPVKQLCDALKQTPRFAQQPGRFYTSAERIVKQTYEAWLTLHKGKQAQLEGKKRWLRIVESDTQLAEICNVNLEVVCTKAQEILEQGSTSALAGRTLSKQPKKSKKTKTQEAPSLITKLFDLFDATEDPLCRRAIIHLLKHGYKVSEEEEDPEKLSQRLARKRKEIQRLEEQLQAQTPKGRAVTEQEAEERILQAISLPKHPGLMLALSLAWTLFCDADFTPEYQLFIFTYLLKRVCQFEEARIHFEFLDWEEDFADNRCNLTRSPISLPYPILYGAQDLVKWYRNEKGRICLSFNGLAKDHLFEVRCDRRQLSLFELFLEDWQTLNAKENEGQYSGSFLLLREAALVWKEPKKSIRWIVKKRRKNLVIPTGSQDEQQSDNETVQQSNEQNIAPWRKYHLELHCTVDTQLFTIEGTERIRQEKLARRNEEIEDRSTKSSGDENQDKSLKREQAKQSILERSKHFRRSQRPLYQGNLDILVGISFNLTAPAVIAVIKGSTGETLTFRSTRQLLGDNYSLLNRQQQKQKQHDQQRCKNQQKGRFEQPSESNLGLYIDRLLAKSIITLAKQYQAGSIVIPELKGLRERIQSELEAKAERKIPGSREAQTLYAKQYRKQVHRWSYHRLAKNIQSQAAKVGIQVEVGHQPFQGSPQEKARDLAIMTYHARQISS